MTVTEQCAVDMWFPTCESTATPVLSPQAFPPKDWLCFLLRVLVLLSTIVVGHFEEMDSTSTLGELENSLILIYKCCSEN